jgi:hypothetical protein
MKRFLLAAVWSLAISTVAARGEDEHWSFEDPPEGTLPAGIEVGAGEWAIAAHRTSKVLMQKAASERPVYNIALFRETMAGDVDLRVTIEAISGEIDQGGGLVWRAADAKNYYICRYNPLEDNFRLYKVVDGTRTQLASVDIPRDKRAGEHKIRATMRGDQITCELDGEKLLEARDATFAGPGMIGVWTKADAKTCFDDLIIARP